MRLFASSFATDPRREGTAFAAVGNGVCACVCVFMCRSAVSATNYAWNLDSVGTVWTVVLRTTQLIYQLLRGVCVCLILSP